MVLLSSCLLALLLTALSNGQSAQQCPNAKAQFSTYSTTELIMSSDTVFVADFEVACGTGGDPKALFLHADVSGDHIPVVRASETKFQVSWSAPHTEAKAGIYPVRIYDEEGYAALRKAIRSGQSADSVKPVFRVDINHKGAARPGFIVQTEFIALVTFLLIWWYANSMKGRMSE
ncbi:translocon-associated protein subunit delta-like [Oscarella lobularis]|uniref:translocon-associated protein subunit delta-like n=1 Tax=Oscarella lobularis TaxID=121494 RepID=UPI0033143500